MGQYDDKVLDRAHFLLLDMLKELKRICDKYGINYFIIYGTAIGAVRHNGFIPWDDDIDVGMLYEDYLKLKSVPAEEWGASYDLCNPGDNTNHHFLYPRLYNNDTVFIPDTDDSLKARREENHSKTGLWIDIFTFYKFESINDISKAKRKTLRYKQMFVYALNKKKISMEKGMKRKLLGIGENLFGSLINLIHKKPETYILKKYNNIFKNQGNIITSLDFPYRNCPEHTAMEYDDYFPLRTIAFEDIIVKIPNKYDKQLRNIYGDYMQLPPADRRVNHSPKYYDFGEGIKNT